MLEKHWIHAIKFKLKRDQRSRKLEYIGLGLQSLCDRHRPEGLKTKIFNCQFETPFYKEVGLGIWLLITTEKKMKFHFSKISLSVLLYVCTRTSSNFKRFFEK